LLGVQNAVLTLMTMVWTFCYCVFFDVQEMSSLGLQSVFCATSENVDSVKFINNVYHLIKRYSSVRELADRQDGVIFFYQ